MKIAFVVPGFSADENDWCIPAHTDIVKMLAATNEVHVFAMRYPHRVDAYRIGNASVHSFNGVGSRGIASAQLWKNVLQHIARENKRGRFNVVHAIFGSEAGCVAVLAGKFLRVPSVVWFVDGELIGLREIEYGADLIARQRWMNKMILRFADGVLCGCESLTETARERKARARVETLPLGVDLKRFGNEQGNEGRRGNRGRAEFVNVGSLVAVKDQATLLRAFSIVTRNLEAHLTIAGTGGLENELRALAAQSEISERVTFAGSVPHDQLAALYQNAAVFVQASRHEGQGMALLEAAACGCAVCGTSVGALADLARREAAIVCEPNDARALAETMARAYRERASLAPRVGRIVASEYNLEHVAGCLLRVYSAQDPKGFRKPLGSLP